MKDRRLGRTGLRVPEIGLGTMTFGTMADEGQSLAILDKAFDAGLYFMDLAEVYPVPPDPKWATRTEQIVGKWMQGRRRDSLILATKVAGSRRRLVPGAGSQRPHRARSPFDRARLRRQPAPTRHRLHRSLPDALARSGLPDRRDDGGAHAARRRGQGARRRVQQRERLRPHQEPVDVGQARLCAPRDDPEQLLAAESPLRGRARRSVSARTGRSARLLAARRRRALRQVPGRRDAEAGALHLVQRAFAAHQDDDRAIPRTSARSPRPNASGRWRTTAACRSSPSRSPGRSRATSSVRA